MPMYLRKYCIRYLYLCLKVLKDPQVVLECSGLAPKNLFGVYGVLAFSDWAFILIYIGMFFSLWLPYFIIESACNYYLSPNK